MLFRIILLVVMAIQFVGCATQPVSNSEKQHKDIDSLGFNSDGLDENGLKWLDKVGAFYFADLQTVKMPYISLLNELENWPAADYCADAQMQKIRQALALNPSSVLAYDLTAYCAKRSGDTVSLERAAEAIQGISNVLFRSGSGVSPSDPIQVKDAYEAQIILRWAGQNVFDIELVSLNQKTVFRLHTRDQETDETRIVYADNSKLFQQNLLAASKVLYSEKELSELLTEGLIKAKNRPALFWQMQNQIFNDDPVPTIEQLIEAESLSPLATVLLNQALLNANRIDELGGYLDQLIMFSEMGFVEASATSGLVLLSSKDSQESDDAINLFKVNINSVGLSSATHSWLKAFLSQPLTSDYLSLFWKKLPAEYHQQWHQSIYHYNNSHSKVTLNIQTKLAQFLEQLGEAGYQRAKLDYADLVLNGSWGQKQDISAGLAIIEGLASEGYARAQLVYGVFYSFGKYGLKKDFEQSYQWYAKAAAQGNRSAQYNLGLAYRHKRGVDKDILKSIGYFKQALENNFWLAACRLGDIYNNEDAVLDPVIAESYYRKAINNLDVPNSTRSECAYSLGSMLFYQQNKRQSGIEQFKLSANLGDKDALFELGIIYSGSQGVTADPELSVDYYKKAISAGSHRAAANLGYKYEVGEGVVVDRKKALSYYRYAASGNSATGKNNYATFLRYGTEIEKDVELAKKFYLQSFEMGNDYAANNLGDMYYYGEFGEPDYQAACQYYEVAVKRGFLDALYDTGYCYLHGEGQELDVDKGISYMNEAYKHKSADAAFSLGALYLEGSNVMKDKVLSTVYFEQSAKWGLIRGMLKTAIAYLNGVGTRPDISKAREWLEKAAALGSKDAQEAIQKIDGVVSD